MAHGRQHCRIPFMHIVHQLRRKDGQNNLIAMLDNTYNCHCEQSMLFAWKYELIGTESIEWMGTSCNENDNNWH